jgi:hypothetical protein
MEDGEYDADKPSERPQDKWKYMDRDLGSDRRDLGSERPRGKETWASEVRLYHALIKMM